MFSPIPDGMAYIDDFSEIARDFDMKIADEGSDYMRFSISSEEADVHTLADWFERLIGCDVRVELADRIIWRGIIRRLTFSVGNDAEYRDLDTMSNEVIVKYEDANEETQQSAPIQDPDASPQSVLYFGRKQLKLDRSELSQVDAEKAAAYYAKMNAWPRAFPYAGDRRTYLEFDCAGYMYTLNWLCGEVLEGQTVQASIKDVVDQTGQMYITYQPNDGSIYDNGQVWNTDIDGTGRNMLDSLTEMLDIDGNPWRFWLDTDNVLHWQPIDFTPFYSKRGGHIPNAGGSQRVGKWQGRAGVIMRNTTYPIDTQEPGSPFLSRQDRYIEAIRFRENGEPIFETLQDFPESWAHSDEWFTEGVHIR